MAEQLAASRESERNFLLSVSHELKTPLTAIRGYAEGLGRARSRRRGAPRTILLESRRLERLVRDLLDLARMNRQRILGSARAGRPRRGRPRGGRAARGGGARVRGRARGRGPSEAWVEADHDRVLQVASNLVENALRETPRSGSVDVRAEGPSWQWPTRARARPRRPPARVRPFLPLRQVRPERPVGSGLGLAIVEQLAEAMRGRVSVDSAPGRGTVFRLTLPSGPKPRRVDDREVGAVQAT